jgi:hypothetical protein
VQVRVDQRRELQRGLDAVVERQAQLPQQREVGAEAGRGDHFVGHDLAFAVGEHDRRVAATDGPRLKAGCERDRAVCDQAADRGAERSAGRQLVVSAAAVFAPGRAAADGPHDLRGGRRLAERHEVQDRVEGRMAAADHNDPLTRIAGAVGAEHVWDAVGDPVGERALAGNGQPACAERVRPRPGSGGVDHRGRQVPPLYAALVDDQFERGLVAAGVLELVDAGLGDARDARVEVQRAGDLRHGGERLDVSDDEFGAGRVAIRIGCGPVVAFEQRDGGRVDVVLPG